MPMLVMAVVGVPMRMRQRLVRMGMIMGLARPVGGLVRVLVMLVVNVRVRV